MKPCCIPNNFKEEIEYVPLQKALAMGANPGTGGGSAKSSKVSSHSGGEKHKAPRSTGRGGY